MRAAGMVALWAALVCVSTAQGAFRIPSAQGDDNRILMPANFDPLRAGRLLGTQFSVLQQYGLLSGAEVASRDVSAALGVFAIRANTVDDRFEMHLLDANDQTIGDPIVVDVPGLWFNSQIGFSHLYLIGMNVDSTVVPATVQVFVGNYATGALYASAVETRDGAFATDAGDIGIGSVWTQDGTHASDIGMLVLRRHAMTQQDFAALVSSQKYTVPLYYSGSGAFNGLSGVEAALHGGVRAGLEFGASAANSTVFTYDRIRHARWIITPSGVSVTGTLLHADPFAAYRYLERTNISEAGNIPMPVARAVGESKPSIRRAFSLLEPEGKTRVTLMGNSRAVWRVTAYGIVQNYLLAGVAQLDPSRLIGVDLVQPAIEGDAAWPLIDFSGVGSGSAAANVRSDVVFDNAGVLTRWGQNKTAGTPLGNGPVVRVNPAGHYRTLASPYGGVTALDPLVSSHIFLAYPGSQDAEIRPVASTSQSAADVTLGDAEVVGLDTTQSVRVIDPGDTRNSSGVTIVGATGLGIEPGWMVYNATQQTWTLVDTVMETEGDEEVPGDTVLTFVYIVTAPEDGDELRFGPWAYVRGSVVNEGDELNEWRGIKTTQATTGGGGQVCIIGCGAELVEGEGNVYTTFGASADGFGIQLGRAAPGSIAALLQLVDPDVFIATPADQQATYQDAVNYISLVRDAIPGADIVAAGDPAHMTSTTNHNEDAGILTVFNAGFLNNALAEGWVAIDASRGDSIGRVINMTIGGLRFDQLHLSALGNLRAAQEWQRLIETLDIQGDLNGDGTVSGTDLGLLLGGWGACPEAPAPCPADLNGDGVVDGTDLGILLGSWG